MTYECKSCEHEVELTPWDVAHLHVPLKFECPECGDVQNVEVIDVARIKAAQERDANAGN